MSYCQVTVGARFVIHKTLPDLVLDRKRYLKYICGDCVLWIDSVCSAQQEVLCCPEAASKE